MGTLSNILYVVYDISRVSKFPIGSQVSGWGQISAPVIMLEWGPTELKRTTRD